MSIAAIQLVVVIAGVALFVWWIRMLLEVLRTPTTQWERADQSQLIYVILMALLNVVGTALYVTVARPRLRVADPARTN